MRKYIVTQMGNAGWYYSAYLLPRGHTNLILVGKFHCRYRARKALLAAERLFR